jgi:hypothetical protein
MWQGTSWQHNQEKFESFATASLQLCEAYIETSQKGGSVKDASAAVMHLRNTLKQVTFWLLFLLSLSRSLFDICSIAVEYVS